MIALLAWSAWLLTIVIGLSVFLMRSAETGLTYINLPGFLYYVWIIACSLILAHMRAPIPAAMALGVAIAVGLRAVLADEPVRGGRQAEIVERVKGCRRALEADKRNPASLELLGDVYSTLGSKVLALKYWSQAYEIWSQAKLLEKIESVKRADPVFFVWGSPCAEELRACPGCESVLSRLEFSCRRCGEAFFADRAAWFAMRFNRVYETSVAGPAVEMGLLLLPFLFLCEPWAYAAAWLVWIGARRPASPEVV